MEKNTIKTSFLNDDHTAKIVSLFAFGTMSNNFIGTYDNTDVYQKIINLFKLSHK